MTWVEICQLAGPLLCALGFIAAGAGALRLLTAANWAERGMGRLGIGVGASLFLVALLIGPVAAGVQ